jgi:LytS/YehU family sensor histidine kinase
MKIALLIIHVLLVSPFLSAGEWVGGYFGVTAIEHWLWIGGLCALSWRIACIVVDEIAKALTA